MGLDIYINKFSKEEYRKHKIRNEKLDIIYELQEKTESDEVYAKLEKQANEISKEYPGGISIEVGYFRKNWSLFYKMRDLYPGYFDNAHYTHQLTKEDVETILRDCHQVLDYPPTAAELMPNKSTAVLDHDGWYYVKIHDIMQCMAKLRDTVDWNNEVVEYHESY